MMGIHPGGTKEMWRGSTRDASGGTWGRGDL